MSVRSLIRLLGPGAIVKHYGPIHPGTGTDQSVHGGGGSSSLVPNLYLSDRTGIPEIDSAIEDFLNEPLGDWTTDDTLVRDLTPERAHGACELISQQFVDFLEERGIPGSGGVRYVAVERDVLEAWGYEPQGPPHGEVMNDEGNVVPGFYGEHAAVSIYVEGKSWPIVVDFSALQYGYPELPKVSKARQPWPLVFVPQEVAKHYGPGPHPGTGTPQSVHGAPFLSVGTGDTVNRDVITDAEGNPAPISMAVLPEDLQAKVIEKAKEFGRTPEDIQANIDMVFKSAADRYELMDADRSWHDGDIAEWLKDREYDGYRDMLVEQKDDKWRWAEKAGSKLRDIDRFYASHHEWLYELSDTHDQPFGEVVGYHAAISPGLRAAENLRFSELAVQYWDANPKFTAEEAAYINEWLDADQQKILAKGGWRAERIAPQLDFEVEAGDSYRQVMDEAGSEAMARIMYRKTLHNGESLSLGRGYQQHATGLTILYRNADVPTTLSGPKVRSFYNNIVDPFADRGDITIDFQTMNAAFNGYGTGDSDFPTDFLSSPAYKGVKLGVRPLVADAVRRGGEAISSRIKFANAAEMQEVLWAEWKRGLPTSGVGRSKRHGEGKWGLEEIRRIS